MYFSPYRIRTNCVYKRISIYISDYRISCNFQQGYGTKLSIKMNEHYLKILEIVIYSYFFSILIPEWQPLS
jgi:hypothetical protein